MPRGVAMPATVNDACTMAHATCLYHFAAATPLPLPVSLSSELLSPLFSVLLCPRPCSVCCEISTSHHISDPSFVDRSDNHAKICEWNSGRVGLSPHAQPVEFLSSLDSLKNRLPCSCSTEDRTCTIPHSRRTSLPGSRTRIMPSKELSPICNSTSVLFVGSLDPGKYIHATPPEWRAVIGGWRPSAFPSE